MKDKIHELRKLRGNIVSMSPKTISSRCIILQLTIIASMSDLEMVDFTDEEAFKKQEQMLINRERKYMEEKLKREPQDKFENETNNMENV